MVGFPYVYIFNIHTTFHIDLHNFVCHGIYGKGFFSGRCVASLPTNVYFRWVVGWMNSFTFTTHMRHRFNICLLIFYNAVFLYFWCVTYCVFSCDLYVYFSPTFFFASCVVLRRIHQCFAYASSGSASKTRRKSLLKFLSTYLICLPVTCLCILFTSYFRWRKTE